MRHTFTYGVFLDEATAWRARARDVTLAPSGAGIEICIAFENATAAGCLRNQVRSELRRFSSSPLVATVVREPDGTLSCHVETDRTVAGDNAFDVEGGASPVKHVETPLRARGFTRVPEPDWRSMRAHSAEGTTIRLGAAGADPLCDACFACRSVQFLERENLTAEQSAALAPVSRSEDFDQVVGQYSPVVLDEEIWAHAPRYFQSCDERSSGRAPEMDCVRQLVDVLRPLVHPGMTLLDIGCGAGHYYLSLRELSVEYYGIDPFEAGIRIGQHNLAAVGLHPNRLQVRGVESLRMVEQYDVVVAFNVLAYLPDFRLPLERMARVCRQILVVRSSFAEATRIRWVPDILLEDGLQDMRMYQNIYSRAEVSDFLAQRGFSVDFLPDKRQNEQWGGRAEIVGGIEIPYEILLAGKVC